MLKLAIASQLPLVAVTTRDTLNLSEVLAELTGKKTLPYDGGKLVSNSLYMLVVGKATLAVSMTAIYSAMTKAESTLVVVNPKDVVEPMFDAGEVPVPRSLLMKFMMAVVKNEKRAEELLRGLGGCTIKEAAELCRLTMARDKSLTPDGLLRTRKAFFHGSRGLTQVESAQDFYDPPKTLTSWVKREKPFFLTAADPRLRPRGLLMDGPPGTGKTAGAKWIAAQLGVPLYRIDVGGTKNKYIGNSEANMLANLGRLDQEEPCVALIDEIEKVFATNNADSSGVTQTMMSQLLWWLAEHKSRVLTVMTTNNVKAIPPELYREGRIDEVFYFGGLTYLEAKPFVRSVLKTFGVNEHDDQAVVNTVWTNEEDKQKRFSQAVLTQAAIRHIKSSTKGGLAS